MDVGGASRLPLISHPIGVGAHDSLADVLDIQLCLEVEEGGDNVRVAVYVRRATLITLRVADGYLVLHVRITRRFWRDICPRLNELGEIWAVRVRMRVGGEHL
jgi:hypothetical protein